MYVQCIHVTYTSVAVHVIFGLNYHAPMSIQNGERDGDINVEEGRGKESEQCFIF